MERSESCSKQMMEKQQRAGLSSLLGWESVPMPVWSGKRDHGAVPLAPHSLPLCLLSPANLQHSLTDSCTAVTAKRAGADLHLRNHLWDCGLRTAVSGAAECIMHLTIKDYSHYSRQTKRVKLRGKGEEKGKKG